MSSSNSHYHVHNTPCSPLLKEERGILEQSYRLVLPGFLADERDRREKRQEGSSSPRTTTRSDGIPSENPVLRLLLEILQHAQIPLISKASMSLIIEFASGFATPSPKERHRSQSECEKGDGTPASDSSSKSSRHSITPTSDPIVPVCQLQDVFTLAEKLKTLHTLWLGAVKERAGSPGERRAFAVDDICEALSLIATSSSAPSSSSLPVVSADEAGATGGGGVVIRTTPSDMTNISLVKLLTSLAEFDLIKPMAAVTTTTSKQDAVTFEDPAASAASDTVTMRAEAIAQHLIQRDILSPPVDVDDVEDSLVLGAGSCSVVGSGWAGSPVRHALMMKGSPARNSASDTIDLVEMLRSCESKQQSDSMSSPRLTQRTITTHEHTSLKKTEVGGGGGCVINSTDDEAERPVPSSATPPVSSRSQTSADHAHAGRASVSSLPSISMHHRHPQQSSSSPPPAVRPLTLSHGGASFHHQSGGALMSLFLLSDVDVPKCPMSLRMPGDVDSDDDGAMTSRKRKGGGGHATSRLSVRSAVTSLLSFRRHHGLLGADHGHSTLGPHPHSGSGGDAVLSHSMQKTHLLQEQDHGSRIHTPASIVKQEASPALSRHSSKQRSRLPHRSQTPSTSSQVGMVSISVGSHSSLQQPEYVRYRANVKQARMVQFR